IYLTDCGQGYFCNPVADAGPRGDWVTMEFSKIQSPCSPNGCTTTWRVGPDGHVTGEAPGKTIDGQLEDFELSQVKFAAYSTELRKGLEDGLPCFDDQVPDLSVSLKLTLSTREYSQNVSGCVSGSGTIANAYRILAKF